ncbi:MAG TPA: hypothetical protein VG937_33870 [Polyangiaceae bacterium]|jgi:hypothetical protein|nr:hypothetical protein [Polyangiaceae bacterium]
METALAFPEPLPEDPEVVATALETAGIFGVQGDMREALRWVRRAAELAGDAGIDDRAFALARAAADLTTNLSGRPESAPPAGGAAPPAQNSGNASAAQVASAPPPPPPPPPVATANRTSSRPQDARPSQPHQAVSVSPIVSLNQKAPQAASSDEEGEITSQHPPHRARPSDAPPRAPQAPQAQTAAAAPGNDALAALFDDPAPKAAAPVAAPQNALGQTLAMRSPDPTPETPTPEPAATLQGPPAAPEPTVRYQAQQTAAAATSQPTASFRDAPRGAGPQALIPTQVYEPVQPEAAFAEERVPMLDPVIDSTEERPSAPPKDSSRQAARASIEQSQEAGVYILRLLKNGEAAPFGTFEAMVVLTEPNAELFSDA